MNSKEQIIKTFEMIICISYFLAVFCTFIIKYLNVRHKHKYIRTATNQQEWGWIKLFSLLNSHADHAY